MKLCVMPTAIRTSVLLGMLGFFVAANRPQPGQPTPARKPVHCFTTPDGLGRPMEEFCADAKKRFISRAYVDTAGRRTALPLEVSRPPRFSQGPEALKKYLQMGDPWSDNIDRMGSVLFIVLIGADGRVKDARLIKSMDHLWPGLTPAARHRVLAMPRWQPALLNSKPVPCLQSVSVRFGS